MALDSWECAVHQLEQIRGENCDEMQVDEAGEAGQTDKRDRSTSAEAALAPRASKKMIKMNLEDSPAIINESRYGIHEYLDGHHVGDTPKATSSSTSSATAKRDDEANLSAIAKQGRSI